MWGKKILVCYSANNNYILILITVTTVNSAEIMIKTICFWNSVAARLS